MDIDKLFAGVPQAKLGRDKTFMKSGSYVVQLKDIKCKESEDPNSLGQPVFICVFDIVESDNPAYRPGAEGSWTLKGKTLGNGMGDILALVLSTLGVDPTKDPSDEARAAAGLIHRWILGSEKAAEEIAALPAGARPKEGYYIGKRLKLVCKEKTSSKTGKVFTQHFWSPVDAA